MANITLNDGNKMPALQYIVYHVSISKLYILREI